MWKTNIVLIVQPETTDMNANNNNLRLTKDYVTQMMSLIRPAKRRKLSPIMSHSWARWSMFQINCSSLIAMLKTLIHLRWIKVTTSLIPRWCHWDQQTLKAFIWCNRESQTQLQFNPSQRSPNWRKINGGEAVKLTFPYRCNSSKMTIVVSSLTLIWDLSHERKDVN